MTAALFTRAPSNALIKRAQNVVDSLVKRIPQPHRAVEGRGIVTCGGGYTYFTNAWVLIRMLRLLGCRLPIQLWYLGDGEMTTAMKRLVGKFGVECVDGLPMIPKNRYIAKGLVKPGWILKSVAITRCPFEEVMYLDSDNLPVRDPSFLFELPQYEASGAIFWPDSSQFVSSAVWRIFRLHPMNEPEFESGQMVIDKRVNWDALEFAHMLNKRAEIFYRLMWGDKDTFRFAWHKLKRSFAMPSYPPQALRAAGSCADMLCQHDFAGGRLFQHRNMYKWTLFGENPWIPGFFFEHQCRAFLHELRSSWNGRCGHNSLRSPARNQSPILKDLFSRTWLLQLPRPSRKETAQNSFRGLDSQHETSDWIELRFDRKGMLSKGAGKEAGTFWDITDSGSRLHLTLSDDKGRRVELTRLEVGWRGKWVAGVHKNSTTMLTQEDAFPRCLDKPGQCRIRSGLHTIRASFGKEVHLGHSGAGIGDHIVATYACTALARAGVRVVFHTMQAEWLARIHEPGLIISGTMPERIDHDFRFGDTNELRYANSRAFWYARGLHRLLRPVRPHVDQVQTIARLPFERYILLAPFASRAAREWPEVHWTRLGHMLRESGYEVVAVGRKRDAERLERVFSSTHVYWVTGHPPAWVMDTMLGACAYIGIDSGMTHLAALLRVKAIAIHSQLTAEFLWPNSTVIGISPQTRCVFCRFQHDQGWLDSCATSCSALASVPPDTVLDVVIDVMRHKKNVEQLSQARLERVRI